jgi:uracil-DNA glycosylase
MKEKIQDILLWYKYMGVDEIQANQPGKVLKNLSISNSPCLHNELDLPKKARQFASQASTIEQLKEYLDKFDGLSIKKTANNTVFSDGNPNSSIMIIGEAPGANEDEEGIPFCGASGQLLDKILLSIGLEREKDFYITNSVFWRPPGNRKPTNEETDICLPFVEKHIALIKPKLILLVGSTAAATLLQSNETISRLRGKFYQYNNQYLSQPIPATVIFHPSYLLRQPLQKKTVWFDLLKIKKTFDFIDKIEY